MDKQLLISIRQQVRALPDGWPLADERELDDFAPSSAAFVYLLLDEPAPEIWAAAYAEPLLDRLGDMLADEASAGGAVQFKVDAAHRRAGENQKLSVASRRKNSIEALKKGLLAGPQGDVLSMEKQLGADATSKAIADGLFRRKHGTRTGSNVAKTRKTLRGKGF